MPKSRAVLSEPGDVEMNANSSSGAKLKKKKAVSTVIRETRSGNAKRKAVPTTVNNEKSDLNDNDGSSVTRELETERISATEPKSTMSNKRVRYTEPTLEDLETVRGNARVKATHKATEVWIRALEEFRSDVGYKGKIEEIDVKEVLEDQLSRFVCAMKKKDGSEYQTGSIRNCMSAIWRHLNQHSVMSKPIEILNPKVYFDLNTIVDGKLKNLTAKGLGERTGSDGLTLQEVEQILSHRTMQRDNPEGLLRRIFFYNSILLALRGGEHHDLRIDNFVKRFDGGIDVKLYRSKTNQRGIGDYDGKAEVISLPNIKSIIDDYEFYFIKRPVTKVTNFYLSPVPANTVEFSGQWYYERVLGEKKLRAYFRAICESTDIQFGGRNLSNHSGRKTAVQVLKELGYSDSVVMSITRHKSQKGLAAYERPKSVMQHEGINGFFRALTVVNNGEGSYKENEAPSAKMDYAKDMVGEFKRESSMISVGGFKRASSIISLTSKLAGDLDNLEISSAVNVYEPPEEIDTNESPGKTVADEPPGATEPQSRTQKVLDEIVPQEVCRESIQSEESRKEFIEKFLTGNTFNNCVFHF